MSKKKFPKIESGFTCGRWTVIKRVKDYISPGGHKHKQYLCECSCKDKTRKTIDQSSLRQENSKSCGCLNREVAAKRLTEQNTTHGYSRHPLYVTWYHMIDRCYKQEDDSYNSYGARGIKVYKKWRKDPGRFIKWVEKHLGSRPSKQHTLDRIDNSGNYEPGNLKWATEKEQAQNMRSNKVIEFNGKEVKVVDLVKRYNVPGTVIRKRYNRGTRGAALVKPVDTRFNPPAQ